MKIFNELFSIDWNIYKVASFRRFKRYYYLHPISDVDLGVGELLGLEEQINALMINTKAFMEEKEAFNALLWGARGCGKSSVIKKVIAPYLAYNLRVIELDSKDILVLPLMLDWLRDIEGYRFIIFCDDLSFYADNKDYKSIKSTLEGSFEKWARNVLLYATSNMRRILEFSDKEDDEGITQEYLSFSDRFGLNISFYALGMREFLRVVAYFLTLYRIKGGRSNDFSRPFSILETNDFNQSFKELLEEGNALRLEALNFATKVGNRNARTAKIFAQQICGFNAD